MKYGLSRKLYIIFGKTTLEGKLWCRLLEFIEYVCDAKFYFYELMNIST